MNACQHPINHFSRRSSPKSCLSSGAQACPFLVPEVGSRPALASGGALYMVIASPVSSTFFNFFQRTLRRTLPSRQPPRRPLPATFRSATRQPPYWPVPAAKPIWAGFGTIQAHREASLELPSVAGKTRCPGSLRLAYRLCRNLAPGRLSPQAVRYIWSAHRQCQALFFNFFQTAN